MKPWPEPPPKQPDIVVPGMAVDDEVIVGAVLILADARLEQRRILQRGKAEGDVFPDGLQSFRADGSFPRGGIELGTARIVGDFEASALIARNAVHESGRGDRPRPAAWLR